MVVMNGWAWSEIVNRFTECITDGSLLGSIALMLTLCIHNMSCFTVTSGCEAEPDENVRLLDAGIHCQGRQCCSSSSSLRLGLAPRGDAGTPHVHPPGRFGGASSLPFEWPLSKCMSCCWDVRCWLLIVCVLLIHSRQSNWSRTQPSNGDSLFLSSLSCFSLVSLSLSLSGLSHTLLS